MKCFVKVLCAIGGIFVAAKLTQFLIDYLYENFGKHYITTDSLD